MKNFSFVASKERIRQELGKIQWTESLENNYNISACDQAYIILGKKPLSIGKMEWGLIPEWSNDGINKGNLLTSPVQGISSKTSYRMPVRKRRCIVLADSFYVWSSDGVPYRVVRRDDALLFIAGVWEMWRKHNIIKKTFAILMGPANKDISRISKQMPAMLFNEKDREEWLFNEDFTMALELLKTPESLQFKYYRVTDKLKDPNFKRSEIHAAVPDLKTLFD